MLVLIFGIEFWLRKITGIFGMSHASDYSNSWHRQAARDVRRLKQSQHGTITDLPQVRSIILSRRNFIEVKITRTNRFTLGLPIRKTYPLMNRVCRFSLAVSPNTPSWVVSETTSRKGLLRYLSKLFRLAIKLF